GERRSRRGLPPGTRLAVRLGSHQERRDPAHAGNNPRSSAVAKEEHPMRTNVSSTTIRQSTAGETRMSERPHDVLLVEDDDLVRHALKRLLVTDGRECVAAASVEAAQQLLVLHAPGF